MGDADCRAFMQWALPRLGMHWPGFRKVRGQVCKRIRRRMSALGVPDFTAYRARLASDPDEWRALDACCHITISRFHRDRGVFEGLRKCVLPAIAARSEREGREARCWSAGCASGEEAYTLRILWDLKVAQELPRAKLSIVATDIDDTVLRRARNGVYESGALKDLPRDLVEQGFQKTGSEFRVREQFRESIIFLNQDLRSHAPNGLFDLVLCRNLAFTYFVPPLRRDVLRRIAKHMRPAAYLVIGAHESLPEGVPGFEPVPGLAHVFRLRPDAADNAS